VQYLEIMEDATYNFVSWILLGIALYFAPTILAAIRKKKNGASIFIVNFFFGWTLIGWVVALAWAFAYEEAQKRKIEEEARRVEVREGDTHDSTTKNKRSSYITVSYGQFGIAVIVLIVIGAVVYGGFNVGGSTSSSTASSIVLPSTNEQLKEVGENKVSLDKLTKGFNDASYMQQITFNLTFANNTEKNIKGFEGIVDFSDIFDNEIQSVKFSYDQGLQSHYEVTIEKAIDYNPYIDSDRKLKEISNENLKYKWRVTTILYEDGTKETY